MKKCINCQKDVPDSALHCVFCGAKQPAPSAEPKPAAKTVMGYEAADVLKEMRARKGESSSPAASTADASLADAPGPDTVHDTVHEAAAPAVAGPEAATVRAAPVPRLDEPARKSSPMARTVAARPSAARPVGQLPEQQAPHMVETLAAPLSASVPGAPPPAAPPPAALSPAVSPAAPPIASATPASSPMAPYPAGAGLPLAHAPGPAAPAPVLPPATPPYLASQTHNRVEAPQEPWVGTLELLMFMFGVSLVLFFVLPWTLTPKTQFSWDVLGELSGKYKLPPLLLIGSGILAAVLSRLPLSVKARGVSALVAGYVPLVLLALLLSVPATVDVLAGKGAGEGAGEGAIWQRALSLVASLTLIAGLLLRSQYHPALLARLLVTIGAACLLVPQLVPDNALLAVAKGIGDAPGKSKLVGIALLVPSALTVIGLLLTWLPTSGPVGTRIIAWLLILWPLAATITSAVATAEGPLGDVIKGGLYTILWHPSSIVAWTCLTGYGLASILGKSLEHPE